MRIFRGASDRYQTFLWNCAFQARFCAESGLPGTPIPVRRAGVNGGGGSLIEPFSRGTRLIG
jgi:hypothetical protein